MMGHQSSITSEDGCHNCKRQFIEDSTCARCRAAAHYEGVYLPFWEPVHPEEEINNKLEDWDEDNS
jgi:hypothetical protein